MHIKQRSGATTIKEGNFVLYLFMALSAKLWLFTWVNRRMKMIKNHCVRKLSSIDKRFIPRLIFPYILKEGERTKKYKLLDLVSFDIYWLRESLLLKSHYEQGRRKCEYQEDNKTRPLSQRFTCQPVQARPILSTQIYSTTGQGTGLDQLSDT